MSGKTADELYYEAVKKYLNKRRSVMRFQKAIPLVISLSLIFTAALLTGKAESADMDKASSSKEELTVSAGMKVSIEYTLRLDDGKIIDSSTESEPLVYAHGTRQIIPGLEKALSGMKLGESRKVTIRPEDAYGQINSKNVLEVSKEQIDKEALVVGTILTNRDKNGRTFYARITEIKEKTVVLDFNHPMAGKTLHFDVKVIRIEDALEAAKPEKSPAG